MANAFGIDCSRHQGLINWDIVKAHPEKVVFTGVRAGVSWGYQDSWFPRNWKEAKRVKILRSAYHVLYPGEDVVRQMDNFFGILGNDLGDLPLTEDVELDHGCSKRTITNAILACDKIILARTGRHLILYSRADWANTYMYPSELAHLDWWLAQYLNIAEEHPGPPDLPRGVKRWLVHQTGDHTPSFGCESLMLDYDRWNGVEEDVYRYAGLTPPPVQVPAHVRLKVTANLRLSPDASKSDNVVGTAISGKTLPVEREVKDVDGRVWYEVEGLYVAGWLTQPVD